MSESAESGQAEKPVFCANCGERNPRSNKFCGSCGTPIVLPPEPPTPVTVTTPSVVVEPRPAPVPAPTPPSPLPTPVKPPVEIAIPTDPLARERELERLLTRANVERARALVRDSRTTLEQALVLAPHVSPTAAAPVYEQLGDLLLAEERYEQAKGHYEKALELSGGKRASAEKKLGEMAVRLSDQAAMERLGGALGPSEDLVDVLRDPRTGKRHAGVAMLLSLAPGFGQFYCGQIVKAGIILGVFVISFFIVFLMPDRDALFQHLAGAFAMGKGKLSLPAPSTTTVGFAVIAFCAWLYSVADAPFSAAKTDTIDAHGFTVSAAPMGNRSDWEP